MRSRSRSQRRSPAEVGSVLVTGCSRGIGRATAARLAARGLRVWATARRAESIADLDRAGCRTLALDVTDEGSMAAAVRRVEEEDGAVGALVNNAGYSQSGAVELVSMEDVRRQFETNVFGLLRLCQLVLPAMRARHGGRIVNMSSMGGRLVFPGGGVYHASKHAVEALSDALRFEVAGFGVDVVVIEPGLIRSDFGEVARRSIPTGAADDAYAGFQDRVGQRTVNAYRGGLGRLGGGPDAVARVVERALTAVRPRTRYRVTASARVLLAAHAVLPDRGWDALVGRTFTAPDDRVPL